MLAQAVWFQFSLTLFKISNFCPTYDTQVLIYRRDNFSQLFIHLDKCSRILRASVNYRRKKFYNASLGCLVLVQLDSVEDFTLLSNLRCSGLNLSHRQFFLLFIHLDKCSRIFQTFVNYRCKKFYNASLGQLVLVQFDCGRFLHTLVLLNL